LAKTYTLHLPVHADPGDPEALDEAELVKDGFSWGAFFFTFLWFFFHRLWLAGIGMLIALVALAIVLQALNVGSGTAFVTEVLLALLIGLEANSLRRWTLRRKKPAVDVVSASNRDEAETKAFARWLAGAGAAGSTSPVARASFPSAPYRAAEPVIGLFPDMERRR
jgi:hypothetical protein